MKDLYIKHNELSRDIQKLRTIKFDKSIRREQVRGVIEEQNRVWKKFKFYDNYLKEINKKKDEER